MVVAVSVRSLRLTLRVGLSLLSISGWGPGRGWADDWPQWRGPLLTGVAPNADPPREWSEERNVRWKHELPGLGHSTPIVAGDRVFLTAAVPEGEPIEPIYSTAPGAHDNAPVTHRHRFVVLAIRRSDGLRLWETTVREELPHEQGHVTASLASPSPVTDGEYLYAHFGSRGLYALDFDGHIVWQRDFGKLQSKHGHGEGSSPLLAGDTLVINWDHEGQSFVTALDKRTGRERWKVLREEITSWATPIVVTHEGRQQVIVSGTERVRAYDLETGAVIWQCGGLSQNIIASPVAGQGLVFIGSSYELQAMFAVRLAGATGDITGSPQVVWSRDRATPYVPSLLLYDDTLYFLRHYQGILSRVRASTGEELPGPFRLGPLTDIYASPVGAANRVYITDLDGTTMVVSHEEIPRVIATNRLDDSLAASAAIAGRELYLRGKRFLYCIAEPATP